jgi:hypothetical protein
MARHLSEPSLLFQTGIKNFATTNFYCASMDSDFSFRRSVVGVERIDSA